MFSIKVRCLSEQRRLNNHFSLTKLNVSHDSLRSTVTNQIAFDQRDSRRFLYSNARWNVVARRWFPNWKP